MLHDPIGSRLFDLCICLVVYLYYITVLLCHGWTKLLNDLSFIFVRR